jgi:hypothetical protein
MTHDWVLDVLADLKSFASRNGLKALADQLDDAEMIAAVEIASIEGRFAEAVHVGDTRSHHRSIAAGENA